MCGIAGVVSLSKQSHNNIEIMLKSLRHRGPDESRIYSDSLCSLGINRLAIVDIVNGMQPVVDPDGRYVVVFNGEIYNAQELIQRFAFLIPKQLQTTEAELILYLFMNYGTKFVEFLSGMFAIAIWDRDLEKLFLIRDRFGEKPIYYLLENGIFAFSSELKTLQLMNLPLSINTRSLFDIFEYGYVSPSQSIFNEVRPVPASSILVFHRGHVELSKYWTLSYDKKLKVTFKEAKNLVEETLKQSVRLQSYAERSAGIYLSGGVDSSLVAFYLESIYHDKIKSFSIGFDNSKFDESMIAKKVANSLGIDHQVFMLNPSIPDLETCLNALDQPFADSSFLPTFFLNKFAKSHGIVVAFGGDGGDEAFLGYDRYRALLITQKFSKLLRSSEKFSQFFSRFNSRFSRLTNAFSLSETPESLYQNFIRLTPSTNLKRIFTDDFAFTTIESFFDQYTASDKSPQSIEQFAFFDVENYLPGDILAKVDVASMANSIETRSPFLDHNLFELAANIPLNYKINSRHSKILLKQIATEKMPNINFYRKKMGFGIPRATWLRSNFLGFVEDTLLGDSCRTRGWFNQNFLQEIIHRHKAGEDFDSIIWPALVIENWAQTRL